MTKLCLLLWLASSLFFTPVQAQRDGAQPVKKATPKAKIQYGMASFYSNKFNGRKTANGEIFNNQKLTAAHNTLPCHILLAIALVKNVFKTLIILSRERGVVWHVRVWMRTLPTHGWH